MNLFGGGHNEGGKPIDGTRRWSVISPRACGVGVADQACRMSTESRTLGNEASGKEPEGRETPRGDFERSSDEMGCISVRKRFSQSWRLDEGRCMENQR